MQMEHEPELRSLALMTLAIPALAPDGHIPTPKLEQLSAGETADVDLDNLTLHAQGIGHAPGETECTGRIHELIGRRRVSDDSN